MDKDKVMCRCVDKQMCRFFAHYGVYKRRGVPLGTNASISLKNLANYFNLNTYITTS
jgi:hypothetical protein